MKKLSISVMLLAMVVTALAQSSLDLGSRATLRQYKTQNIPTHNAYTKALEQLSIPTSHITGLIKFAEGATVQDLEAEGVNIVRTRGDIALVSMPIDEVERISSLKQIKTLQLSRKVLAKMDKVRTAMGVDKIHSGTDLPQAYTGKGVVAGIVDQGLDPNHINFRNTDGSSRIQQLTHIYATNATSDGYDVDMYTPATISKFKTDNYDTFHGSHTL
ncbi:MAG: peptidase, partial [Muribaculaceae bacterium]|nr:peptidase [Muribaculaceae bacterium]